MDRSRDKRNGRAAWALALGVLLPGVPVLSGCGGGGHSGDSRTTIHGELRSGDQTLSDGTYVDVYSCVARDDGTAHVDLKTGDFDSAVIVGIEDNTGRVNTIASDGDPGGSRDSGTDFNVGGGIRYFVAATDNDGPGRTGSYELDFSDNLRDVREETNITPAVRAAALAALRASRAKAAPQPTP